MRILVTGGAGYVGGFTARHLLAAGHQVTVIDNLSEGHRTALPAGMLTVGEIADQELVRRVIAEHQIEMVLHFAAFANVGVSVEDPRIYYRNNVADTLSLLEVLHESAVRRIVFSSTCSIYGDTSEMPLREDVLQRPGNPYAFTKYCIERMIQDFGRAYGFRYVLLRYFNASGAASDGSQGEDHRPETHLIPLVLQTLLGQRELLEVFGTDYPTADGTCIRDYVHVEDLATIHALAAKWCMEAAEGQGEIFNVGSGKGQSVLEVIRAAEAVTGCKVPWQARPRRAGDPPRLIASCQKACEMLGWKPRFDSIEDIVASAWKWHETHPEGYPDD